MQLVYTLASATLINIVCTMNDGYRGEIIKEGERRVRTKVWRDSLLEQSENNDRVIRDKKQVKEYIKYGEQTKDSLMKEIEIILEIYISRD